MRYLFLLLSMFLISVAGKAQTQHWNLYLNKEKKLSASVDTIQQFQLSKSVKGTLKLSFPDRSKDFNRTVIMMTKQRSPVMEKEMAASCKTASFRLDSLLSKTGGQPFTIYLRDIPANPKKAMMVRIAPVAICDVQWKE